MFPLYYKCFLQDCVKFGKKERRNGAQLTRVEKRFTRDRLIQPLIDEFNQRFNVLDIAFVMV